MLLFKFTQTKVFNNYIKKLNLKELMTLFYLYYLTKNLTYHIKKICFLVINILKPEKKSI